MKESTRQLVIDSISERLRSASDSRQTYINWLSEHFSTEEELKVLAEKIYLLTFGKVLVAAMQEMPVANVAIRIGKLVRIHLDAPVVEKETKSNLFMGMKVLEAYCNTDKPESKLKLLDLGKVVVDNTTVYEVRCVDQDLLKELIDSSDLEFSPDFPLLEPAGDWTTAFHDVIKAPMVRKAPNHILKSMTPDSTPRIYDALNKLQRTGFLISPRIFEVYEELFSRSDRELLFSTEFVPPRESPFKHDKETRKESRIGMFLEANFIKSLCDRIGDRTFYHGYNCDFRGRIYPLTPFLNEQSSDNAKGLLRYENSTPLGDNGEYWLAVHLANSIGEDKLPLDGRAQYVIDNMDAIMGWAKRPLENTGWMKADKPWSTLAAAMEFQKLEEWHIIGGHPKEEYNCDIPIFIDGTNNGVQHLTALSLDEQIAPLVNLCDNNELPGDVYMFVAEAVWGEVDRRFIEMGDHPVKEELQRLIQEIKSFKLERETLKGGTPELKDFRERLDAWRSDNKHLIVDIAVPFWHMYLEDKKLQRKTIKRPVMTLGYGATISGVRNQIFEDTQTLSEPLKFKDKPYWTNPFADLVMSVMLKELKGPAILLNLFETLATEFNTRKEHLGWTVPITNFKVLQQYYNTKEDRPRLNFCKRRRIRITIQPDELNTLNKQGQKRGASPNIVHSFDAAHLTLIVNESPFIVTTVHDSFGSHPGNMEDLFRITREEFVRFYEADPLIQLLTQCNALHLLPNRGNLNLKSILNSEFAFS